jgi:hypothetical protein
MEKKKRNHPGDPPVDGEVVITTVACGLRAELLLSMRGPTLIVDEYFTSQTCPCGHPLENVPAAQVAPLDPTDASRRHRRHTGFGGEAPCCAMRPFSDEGTDRDELACMCILQCVAAGLNADPSRPAHLSLRGDPDAWRKGKLAHTAK